MCSGTTAYPRLVCGGHRRERPKRRLVARVRRIRNNEQHSGAAVVCSLCLHVERGFRHGAVAVEGAVRVGLLRLVREDEYGPFGWIGGLLVLLGFYRRRP